MALTSARQILNKKILGGGSSADVQELKVEVAALSASVLTIGGKVDDMGSYAAEETIIGSYLGAPLYRKVYTFEESFQINSNSWDSTHFTFETMGLTGLNRILSMRVNTNGATDDAFYAVYCGPDLTNNKISVYNNLGNAITVKTVIIEYTKSVTESKKKTTKKK